MAASVSELARRLGVSKSTVSLALNNKPHVSEAMRKKVVDAWTEMKEAKSSSPRKRTDPLKILLIHPASMGSVQVFRELLQGIQSGLESIHGRLTLAVHQPPLHPTHTTSVLLHDPALKPDGVILMGAVRDDPILSEIKEEGLPCVLTARESAPEGFSTVGMENFEGARNAVEHLIGLGHRKIAFVGGRDVYEYVVNRKEGYKAAMKAAGLSSEGLIFPGAGEAAAKDFLKSARDAMAVFFVNDEHAIAGLRVFAESGIGVPRDLSVIGFDDTLALSSWDPPISSVRVPRFEIGEMAVKVIAEHIAKPDLKSIRVMLRTHLKIRESSLRPCP